MSTLAILPMKSFKDAKQRLGVGLEPATRRLLAEAMFADVLVALRRAGGVDGVLVVSRDHRAQQIAGAYGASLLGEDDRGHNYAAARGIRRAIEEGVERALVVPGDCPVLNPAQVDELLAVPIEPPAVLIVPDRHGTGTNALVLTPPDAMAPSFGPGSRQRHEDDARAAEINHEVVEIPSLALDVDTPEDLEYLRATLSEAHGGAAQSGRADRRRAYGPRRRRRRHARGGPQGCVESRGADPHA
jgi:2-phospho-L-lactate/phosphoenolpyruvate guanylyltransferase